MDKLTIFLTILLGFALSISFMSTAHAQDIDVLITPSEAELDPGEGLQLETFAFSLTSSDRAPVAIDEITWSVSPDSMGTITEDGFFIAGRHFGVATIRVVIRIGDRTIVKEIVIRIGKRPTPFFRVKVLPERAVVPAGTEQQFRVVVTRANIEIAPKFVRWQVIPEDLGKIDAEGLFTAGEQDGHGQVVVHVEIDGLTLRGSAHVIVSPPATASIAGKIFSDADPNMPIQGAVVRAVRLGRIHWIQRTESDQNGDYLLDELIPGVYVLTAHAKGFIGEFYNDTRNYLEATPLKLDENEKLAGIDFGLSEGGKIAGEVVVDDEQKMPLAGAHVVAFLVVNPRFAKHAITDSEGSYTIESLPTGSYAVRADAAGYKGEFFDDKAEFADADFVDIEEPQTVDGVNFALSTGSAILGTVTAEGGDPIAGAHIRVFGSHDISVVRRHVFRETRTNENGQYIIQVRPGTYIVQASAEGFNSEFYDNVRDRSFATPVVVEADSHTTGVDFELVPRSSIAGKVTDASGNAIADAVVEAFKENAHFDGALTNAGFRAKTDSDGNYLIENVPAGLYIMVAVAEGYLPEFYLEKTTKQDADPVTVEENTAVTDIDFTLDMGGCISGLVMTSEDNSPIPKALVRVFHIDSDRHVRSYTNENGEYKVGGLPSGSYYVQVIAKGFFPEFYENARDRRDAKPVEVVAPEETSGIDFKLEAHIDRRGTIAGRVVSDGPEATPILGAVVIAVSPRHRIPHITFTGPEGGYRLTDLPGGRYYVFAWAEGFIGEFYRDAKLFRNADAVIVVPGQVTAGINFGLTPVPRRGIYAVRGRIRARANNAPIEGILVHARLDSEVEVNATTDANGNYVITGLPAGEYKIEATGAGYVDGYFGGTDPDNAATVTVGNGQDAQNIDLDLDIDDVTDVDSEGGSAAVPEKFDLLQNYPNPFNPETSIKYQLSDNAQVTLKIFNILGQEIRTLIDKSQPAGTYTVNWDGKDDFGRQVSSGIYIFQIKAADKFSMSRRMLLLK